jgi:predicted MPP superfamily phosphohydrolase
MQIIHLTDLHFRYGQPFQTRLINALFEDVRQRVSAGASPDAIVFSGDLVQNPDDADTFKRFEEVFFRPLISIVGLTPQEVIFCPGNHDVSFNALDEWKDEREKLKKLLAGDSKGLEEYLSSGPAKAYVRAISSGFYDFVKSLGQSWDDEPLNHVYNFPAKKMSFVAISTAFGCGKEGSIYDRGKLAVPPSQTLRAFQNIPKDHRTFSLMHHTPADLNEQAHRQFASLVEQESEAHFYGHVHLAKPSAVRAPEGSCFLIQGGALYEREGAFNSYSIVDIGPKADQIAAHYRTYFSARDSFDIGINVVKEGTFYSSEAARTYWQTLAPPVDNDDICIFLMDTQADVLRELDKTITGKSLIDTFVDPVITRDGDDGRQKLTTAQILATTNNLVMACDAEYGSTSLVNFLAVKVHTDCVALSKAVVPLNQRNIHSSRRDNSSLRFARQYRSALQTALATRSRSTPNSNRRHRSVK